MKFPLCLEDKDDIIIYKIIQVVRALWLAIKPFYMSVFLRLSRVLPTSQVFTPGYVNTETILHFFNHVRFYQGKKP